jgi:starvation-inducible DNA-binding protein
MATHEVDKPNETRTRTSLKPEAVDKIGKHLRNLLADVFALYLKTKNFHWHMHGSHFRDYHLLLDEQGEEIFAMTDAIAERGRKIGANTLRSIGDISRHQRLSDNDDTVNPKDMLEELCQDNQRLVIWLRATHAICDGFGDLATASLIENWIDEAEHRAWFLGESLPQF